MNAEKFTDKDPNSTKPWQVRWGWDCISNFQYKRDAMEKAERIAKSWKREGREPEVWDRRGDEEKLVFRPKTIFEVRRDEILPPPRTRASGPTSAKLRRSSHRPVTIT